MADGLAKVSPTRGSCTISLPIGEEEYGVVVNDPKRFRKWLTESFVLYPELFPAGFARAFR